MSLTPDTLILNRPDDWHLHLRDGDALEAVVAATARQFARAIIMPNLKPPVTTTRAGTRVSAANSDCLAPVSGCQIIGSNLWRLGANRRA